MNSRQKFEWDVKGRKPQVAFKDGKYNPKYVEWIENEYLPVIESQLAGARAKIKKTTEWIEWFTAGLKKQETYGQKTAIELYNILTPPTTEK